MVLVDSDATFAAALVEMLEARGIRVLWLRNADQAIDVFEVVDVLDLAIKERVVMDSCLKNNAYRVVPWMRTHECASSASLILMVAEEKEIEKWQQRAFRPDQYVIKPCDPADLDL